jgi:hypothetical protein
MKRMRGGAQRQRGRALGARTAECATTTAACSVSVKRKFCILCMRLHAGRALYTAGFTLYIVTIIEIYSVKPDLHMRCFFSFLQPIFASGLPRMVPMHLSEKGC